MDRALVVCFFASGLAGLIYQVVWLRWLILLFGATTLAISTILTAFMGGLALGSWVAGRMAHRVRRPFMAYGLLELGVGALAVSLPGLLTLATPFLTWLTQAAPSYALLSAGRFVLVTAVLLVPTALMGATLPLLAQHVARRWEALGWSVGALYALNTLGAVAGTAAAGFLLLPTIGVERTNLLAVGVNVVVGLTASLLGCRPVGARPGPPAAEGPGAGASPLAPAARLLLVASMGSGAAAMIYEVAWSRALALVLGSSVYAFTVMLTTFLVGLALGSFLMARWADRVTDAGGMLALVQLGVAGSSVAGIVLVQELPYLFVALFRTAGGGYGWLMAGKFAIASLVLFVPTLFMGAVFPLVVRMVTASLERVGQSVGTVYAVNTLGAIVGSFAGGFLLVPWIGIQRSLLAGVLLNLALAFLLLIGLPSERRRARLVLAGSLPVLAAALFYLVPPWSPFLLSAGVAVYAPLYQSLDRRAFRADIMQRAKLRYYREGLSTTVTVYEANGSIYLRVNGKTDASSSGDMPTQVLAGHLPLLLAREARNVLVIGMGSGVTPGAVTRHPVHRVTVVELEGAVVEASRFFEHLNHRPLQDPRVRLVVNDGRNFLLTTAERFDAIVSEPSNPWMTGASSLFTRDFFQLGRTRLAEDGVFCQWLQLYGMDPAMLRAAIRTFQSVFPSVLVFQTDRDLLLLGAVRPLHFEPALLEARLATPSVAADLRRVGVQDRHDLLARFILGAADVRRLTTGAAVNTDDNALIEFAAPRTLYADTLEANYRQLRAEFRGLDEVTRPAPSGADLLRVAERYQAGRRPVYALALADQLLGRGESPDARTLAAQILLADHREAEALAHLDRALAADPTHLATLLTLARYHLDREAYRDALAVAHRARTAHPASARAAYLLGLSHYGLASYRDALAAFDAVADSERPSLSALQLYRGLSLWRLRKLEAARPLLTAYVAAHPHDALGRYALGVLEFERGALPEATVHWTEGVAQRSREAAGLLAYARGRAGRDEHAAALTDLEAAVKLDPLSAPIRQELATLFERQGRLDEAIRQWEALAERFPSARMAHLRLAELWEKKGNRLRARVELARYLDGESDERRARAIRRRLEALR